MAGRDQLPPDADPRIIQFLDAWESARRGGLVPARRDFDPTRVPRLLSSVYICKWLPGDGDFQCVLAGEEVNRAWGGSLSGKKIGEVIGEADQPIIRQRWLEITGVPEIHYGLVTERMTEQNFYNAERLTVPLADRDGAVSFIMGLSLYTIGEVDLTRPALFPEDTIRIRCADL